MKRKVVGKIKWVQELPQLYGPSKGGTQAMRYGLKFEREFGDWLENKYGNEVHLGPWYQFEDDLGTAVCQPDIVYFGDILVAFECKATFTFRRAYSELRTLYGPVVEKHFGMVPKLVQVCRYLRPSAKKTLLINSMKEIRQTDRTLMTWNWRQ